MDISKVLPSIPLNPPDTFYSHKYLCRRIYLVDLVDRLFGVVIVFVISTLLDC